MSEEQRVEETKNCKMTKLGCWLPRHHSSVNSYINLLRKEVAEANKSDYVYQVIMEFETLILTNPIVRLYIDQMIQDVKDVWAILQEQIKKGEVEPVMLHPLQNWKEMLLLMDHALGKSIHFDTTGLVGFPFNAILDWCMGTDHGLAAFRHPAVNQIMKKILTVWGEFLQTTESWTQEVVTSWTTATATIRPGTNPPTPYVDLKIFKHDPKDPLWGFKNWNEFFTREFVDGARPIAYPDDDSYVINACESTPFEMRQNVKLHDQFWIKTQPYSLEDMFGADSCASTFVGGTVYQAFLDAYSYHRWRAPVSGTIVKAWVIPGLYYSEAKADRQAGATILFDPSAPNWSQSYISHVATRAVFLIQADNPKIGLMAVIPIGMAEVSSCIISVKANQHVNKGDEIGRFQFGGSTHCLVFRKDVIQQFSPTTVDNLKKNPDDRSIQNVGTWLAKV